MRRAAERREGHMTALGWKQPAHAPAPEGKDRIMKLKLALASATALGLMAGAAWAGGNEAYTDQQGQNNTLTVWQDQTSGSDVGSAGNLALQSGEHNTLVIDQDGVSQKVGAAGGDFEQNGFYNRADILQQNSGNNLQTVLQESASAEGNTSNLRNRLFVNQLGTNGLIGNVHQNNTFPSNFTGGNVATITQEASADTNIVENVFQKGRTNTITITEGGGYRNVVGNAYQGQPAGNQYPAEHSSINVTLNGNYNGDVATIGAMHIDGWSNDAGDGNDISQVGGNAGTGNFVTANFTGTANRFGFVQYGGLINQITANVLGNWNQVGVKQTNASNTSLVNITGDFNGVGITQGGANTDAGNLVTVNINSSNNAVVATQYGGNNVASITQ
jgi:hypothetical protein